MPGRRTSRTTRSGAWFVGEVEALLAGARDRDLVALLLEGVLDPASDGVLVFDDQDRGGHAGMLHRLAIGRRVARSPAARPRPVGAVDPW